MNARNGDPLANADALAFAHEDPNASPPCPQHREPLDRRKADARGNFEFAIDVRYASYVAVYCLNGFQSREVPSNDNLRSGTRVWPDPVRLVPTEAQLRTMGIDPTDALQQATALVLDDLGSNLRYFQTSDPDGYGRAKTELSPGDRQIVGVVEQRGGTGRGRPAPTAPGVLRIAILRSLDGAAMDLRYYARVAEGPFFSALPRFTPPERDAIQALRARTPA